MKIDICSPNKKPTHQRIPNWLALNAVTAFFLARRMKKYAKAQAPTARQLHLIFRTVRKEAKRLNGSWQFVEVITRDATQISLRL